MKYYKYKNTIGILKWIRMKESTESISHVEKFRILTLSANYDFN